MSEAIPALQVRMLGDFTMTYQGQVLPLKNSLATKAMRVLQLLLYRGERGIAREALVDSLFSDDTSADPLNNLKVTVSNLRRILVKAGPREMRSSPKGGNRNVTVPLRENGRAILPGSSVKGVIRARVTAIAELLGLEKAVTEELFGRMNRRGENPDNGLPGKVRFEDAVLSGKSQEISRIRINRFTGGVIRQGLFVEEPIRSEITLRITLPEGEARGCGLLLYALRDLGLGLYNLGSGGAVGRGYLAVDTIRAQAPDGTEACLRFDKDRGCTMEDPSGLFARWLDAVRRDEA